MPRTLGDCETHDFYFTHPYPGVSLSFLSREYKSYLFKKCQGRIQTKILTEAMSYIYISLIIQDITQNKKKK